MSALDSRAYVVKLFAADPARLDLTAAIPVMHRWIQTKAIAHDLVIDVADYRHVPGGPGVLLACHGSHYCLDQADGRPGLMYVRKLHGALSETTAAERLRAVLRNAVTAARLLEADLAGLRFRTDELDFAIYDRLLAPNTEAVLSEVKPMLSAVFAALDPGAKLGFTRDAREGRPFGVRIARAPAADLAAFAARLG